jgi:PKD repeat protein
MRDYTKYTTITDWAETTFNPDLHGGAGDIFTMGNDLLSDGYPIPYSFYPYNRPLSGFNTAPSSGSIPLTVTFTDTSSFDPHPQRPDGTAYTDRNRVDSSPITYFWDFGDGTNSTLQNPPPKTYTIVGTYLVTYRVTNAHYTSISSGYVDAGVAPPTPTPTPTPLPTGTPIPTGTPTPVPTVIVYPASPSKVWWSTPNSSTHITSAYYGNIVRYNFDTVVAEANPGVGHRSDYFFLRLWKQNIQTGVWVLASSPYTYPAFNAQVNGTTTNHYIPPSTALPFGGVAWSGWYDISTVDNNKIELVGVNYSYPTYPQYIYGSAIITKSQNPLLVSNLGTWAQSVGGDGLRFFLALVIMLALTCLPYLLLRQFNIYIEIIMFALAVGISFYAGLLDAWVLVVIPLGVLAIYILMRNQGGTQ